MSTTSPRRSPRKAPAERAAELAQAARNIALEQGLAAITLRNVARRAGVAPGLVAHYYPTVDTLVAETFSSIVAAEIQEVAALMAGLPTPRQGLSLLLDTLLDERRLDVTAVWVEAWSLGRRNETLAVSVRDQMDAWQVVIKDLVTAGIAAGEFSTPDAESVAWQVLGMIDGLNAQALVRWNGVSDRHTHLARAVEVMVGAAPSSLLPAEGPDGRGV
ncbi:TetR family transcriptional regulator [Arthrobacter sp. CAU 1506]|uniref:TetR/AcrR family transcriptional regulator n=1 Tax=Arthrobacter sp. CAU 1506 TaxID=2560052 RepID=UPI0010ACC0E7|nr:TetR family transcriptional regulator C-terminal domain-containing protein [Arthrobacter sp. CAU 1506]TJY69574.1 TetR family transcriptional regulator [Arthrobacter sp. CAU 1506]